MNKKLKNYIVGVTVLSGALGSWWGFFRVIAYALGIINDPEWKVIGVIIATAVLLVVLVDFCLKYLENYNLLETNDDEES